MSRSLYDEDGIDGPWLKAMEAPIPMRRADPLAAARKALALAQAKSDKAAAARAALPPGSSRARVTSANARWAVAAEARDRAAAALAKLEEEARGGAA